MKRNTFIKHLKLHNCYFFREGTKHSIYKNFTNGYKTSVPRHPTLRKYTCIEICKQLEIPSPF
ncbi:MAG: type II toxin-antitoxin system HicA family toxin [Cytophagales bacterium]|nr:type II toxin-antitoxin system HicA family toxin [Cytophagales bacterium]